MTSRSRNPENKDFATLKALSSLEIIVGENSNSIAQILKLLGGDVFDNGKGLVERVRDLEEIVSTIKEDVKKEIQDTIHTELLNYPKFSQNKTSKSFSFKGLPLYQKVLIPLTMLSLFGIGVTGFLELLNKFIEWLIKVFGGA